MLQFVRLNNFKKIMSSDFNSVKNGKDGINVCKAVFDDTSRCM